MAMAMATPRCRRRAGSDERGAAERAGVVTAQPLVDAGGMEEVHARRQHPDGLAVGQLRQARTTRALTPPVRLPVHAHQRWFGRPHRRHHLHGRAGYRR